MNTVQMIKKSFVSAHPCKDVLELNKFTNLNFLGLVILIK